MDLPLQIGVVELRQYTLHPGRRDELIVLFDRELVETQEACGMRVLGQFRDEDQPDHFVWLRAFTDMETRREALTAFYSGPVWKEHARAAVATMIDSDDVHLLQPVRLPHLGTRPDGEREPERLWITVLPAGPTADDGSSLGLLRTLKAENTYPALPVHEAVDVVVRLDDREPGAQPQGVLQTIRASCTGRSLLP